jgi:hypothetical protein
MPVLVTILARIKRSHRSPATLVERDNAPLGCAGVVPFGLIGSDQAVYSSWIKGIGVKTVATRATQAINQQDSVLYRFAIQYLTCTEAGGALSEVIRRPCVVRSEGFHQPPKLCQKLRIGITVNSTAAVLRESLTGAIL